VGHPNDGIGRLHDCRIGDMLNAYIAWGVKNGCLHCGLLGVDPNGAALELILSDFDLRTITMFNRNRPLVSVPANAL
jgi:hypothetical protein